VTNPGIEPGIQP